jgi:hypothetical protein
MSDLQGNRGRTQLDNADPVQSKRADPRTPDFGRRRAVTFLAMGVGFATAGLLSPKPAQAYYGRCYKCNCCNFEGTADTCSNCGHSYDNHSGQVCERDR